VGGGDAFTGGVSPGPLPQPGCDARTVGTEDQRHDLHGPIRGVRKSPRRAAGLVLVAPEAGL